MIYFDFSYLFSAMAISNCLSSALSHFKDVWDAVRSLEEALKCAVCNNLLNDPVLIVKCGHTTCKHCFPKHDDMTCPVCKTPINNRDSLEDKQLVELLAQLQQLKSYLPVESEDEVISDSNQRSLHLTSTPIAQKAKSSIKTPSVTPQNRENSIIQETPESQLKTPVSCNRKKILENKKLSGSLSSPNTSVLSPSAKINKKNYKGETLLQVAVIKNNIERVKELLKEGANVNTQDNNGWTPLHEASNHDFFEMVKILLDHGALVNVPSFNDNITPLHDALFNNCIDIAVYLVSRGADLHAKTSFGLTALDMCKTEEHKNLLIEACSPFIEGNTLIPDVKECSTETENLVFLCTNLDEKQKGKLQKCAQMLKAEIVEDFKPDVTHIITSCDVMGNCVRTMKILLAMLTGKWVMNYQWIDVCLEYKLKVDEEVFEVQGTRNQPNTMGPKRSRQNYEQKCPPLFDGFYFYLYGTFNNPTPSRESLCNLIHLGGGKILSREPKLNTIDNFMIPYHAANTVLEGTSHIILYQDKPPRETHVNSDHICTTQVMWLMACISEFKILEPQQTNAAKK